MEYGTVQRNNRFSSAMYDMLDVVLAGPENSMCACPFCGGSKSLSFNDVKGLWMCFRCNEKGTAEKLAKMLGSRYREPEVALDALDNQLRSLERPVQPVQQALSGSYLRRFSGRGKVHEYWLSRGFDDDACRRWELGFDALTGMATMPVRSPYSGELDGIIYRRIHGSGPRYQYPKGFLRSRSLHGSWIIAVRESQHTVITEGPTDCMRVGQAGAPAVAQYGSSLSAGQVQLLHRLGIKSVVLFHDYDAAGIAATRKAESVLGGFSVEKVVWDTDVYCWHEKVCRCRLRHESDDLARCNVVKKCGCGRIHTPDPGSLSTEKIDEMLGRTVYI